MTPDLTSSQRAFYGRRKGRPLRRRQAALFETILPRLALDLTIPAPSDLRGLFPHFPDRVCLEIGFGGGEHLLTEAAGQPEAGFIGCEAFDNGVAKVLAGIEAGGITNVRLHHGDAAELLQWLPTGSLARIDLLYPDPWPKRRHWKRRFIQDDSVAVMARVLRSGGKFRFATDIADYADWTLLRMLRAPDFTWTAERADNWRKPWLRYAGTRYEGKALRGGRKPCYLVFSRR